MIDRAAEKTPSLRRRLIVRMISMMLPLFILLWGVAYYVGLYFVNAAFDRSLVRRTYALADRVGVLHGKVQIDLPVAARELFEFDKEDLLSHSISNSQGEVIEGGPDMPPLPRDKTIQPDQVIIYDGEKDGEKVRVAAFALSLKGTSAKGIALIQVSETLTHRTALARSATLAILLPMLLVTLVAAVAIAYGVGRELDPLKRLQDQIVTRSALDLSPFPLYGTPAELRPFLNEINSLLCRLSEAIDAQSRFVADAAHQLRTPIAGIRAQAEAAIIQGKPQDAEHALQRIALAAFGMGNLVQKLLTLARVDSAENTVQMSRLNSAEVVREISREWAPRLLDAGVEIGFASQAPNAWIMGDVQLLHEMLSNLIDNAQRYGGTQIMLSVQSTAQHVTWSVSDNGPGIPEHQREEVFAPFHRLSSSIEGAGIGLTIVARIARLHDAQLSLASNPSGSGLAVLIQFPVAPA